MFNSIRGRVSAKRPGQLFLENGGVEWDIVMPDSSLANLSEVGSEARVYVYLYHRDDQMRLFGFATPEERALFLELLKVDGVGPRQAVRILSGGTMEQFLARLDEGDIASLSRFPGIGKKTAQKIVLALRGKLSLEPQEQGIGNAELAEALVEMGYDRKAAAEAIAKAMEELRAESTDAPGEQEILKRAIVRLSGPDR